MGACGAITRVFKAGVNGTTGRKVGFAEKGMVTVLGIDNNFPWMIF